MVTYWRAPDGALYEGDCRPADRAATAEEVATHALDRAKAAKDAAILEAFDARVAAGMPYAGKVLQIREADRNLVTATAIRAGLYLQQQAAAIEGVTITWPDEGFPWRMMDDTFVRLSLAEFIAMAQAASDLYGALFYVRSALRDAVAAAETVEAVAAIDPAAGWPV